jgi:hypothetical protein
VEVSEEPSRPSKAKAQEARPQEGRGRSSRLSPPKLSRLHAAEASDDRRQAGEAPRKRRGKAADEPAEAAPVTTPEANNDTDESGEPLRSGWWQRTSARFHHLVQGRGHAKRAPMTSLLSRLTRLLMLALMLAASAWQPAALRKMTRPSILRDSETEAAVQGYSRAADQAAGLDPNSVRVVLLNDPRSMLRCDRADGLHPDRPHPGDR